MSDLALRIIKDAKAGRPKLEEVKGSPLIFTTNGKTAVSGFSRAKERLDAEMERLARIDHDLPADEGKARKQLRLKPDHLARFAAQRCHGHGEPQHPAPCRRSHSQPCLGTIRGVAAVYNRFQYAPERRNALEAWSSYLESLIEGKKAKQRRGYRS